jgi:hypothetical protein
MSDLEESIATQMQWVGLPEPVREFGFHPTRKFRFDFSWLPQKVALEVEGGTWVNGAHNRGWHFESDAEKYNEAAILGWLVIRVTGSMIEDGRALRYVERALEVRK